MVVDLEMELIEEQIHEIAQQLSSLTHDTFELLGDVRDLQQSISQNTSLHLEIVEDIDIYNDVINLS